MKIAKILAGLIGAAALTPLCVHADPVEGNLTINGSLDVRDGGVFGSGTAGGNLVVHGKTGSASGLNLKVSGDGGVFFPSGASSIAPPASLGTGFYWYPAKSSLFIGSAPSSAIGSYSVSIGGGAATGVSSIAGKNSTAGADDSVALGYGAYTDPEAWSSFAFGGGQTYGYFSIAMGEQGGAYGGNSMAINSFAYGYASYALGNYAVATGDYSTALGQSVSQSYMSLALGHNNSLEGDANAWNENDPIFSVGNGTGNTEDPGNVANHDSVTIYKNGKINFYGTSSTTSKIVIDPNVPQITVNGQNLVTSTSTVTQTFSAPSYSFNSGATIRLAIDSSGNIGIGKSAPAARLDVDGNAALGTGVTSGTNQIVVGRYNDVRTNDGGIDHTQGVFVVGSGTSTGAGAANAIRVLADGTVLMKKSGDLAMGSFTNGQRP